MIKRYKFQLLAVWTVFVLILTLMPVSDLGKTQAKYYDKAAHVFLFGIFSYLFYLNLRPAVSVKISASIAAGFGFSLLTEFFQSYIPGRDANHLDLLAGFAGALVFTLIAYAQDK